MSAIEAIKAARTVGIRFWVDGDDLVLEAAAPPPAAVLALLSQNKTELIRFLRPGQNGWSAEEWRAFFDERAGIAEFEAGLSRPEAEAQAFGCCVVEWLNRNPVRSPPRHCLGCGSGDQAHDPLLPYGVESTGHAWLHSRCWPAWYAGRKADAIAALEVMGIVAPAEGVDRARAYIDHDKPRISGRTVTDVALEAAKRGPIRGGPLANRGST